MHRTDFRFAYLLWTWPLSAEILLNRFFVRFLVKIFLPRSECHFSALHLSLSLVRFSSFFCSATHFLCLTNKTNLPWPWCALRACRSPTFQRATTQELSLITAANASLRKTYCTKNWSPDLELSRTKSWAQHLLCFASLFFSCNENREFQTMPTRLQESCIACNRLRLQGSCIISSSAFILEKLFLIFWLTLKQFAVRGFERFRIKLLTKSNFYDTTLSPFGKMCSH